MELLSLHVPFVVGNPKPLFMADNVDVIGDPQVLQGKHLKFRARQNGRSFDALCWDKADWRHIVHRGDRVSLAFSIMTSEYMGAREVSLSIEDLRV